MIMFGRALVNEANIAAVVPHLAYEERKVLCLSNGDKFVIPCNDEEYEAALESIGFVPDDLPSRATPLLDGASEEDINEMRNALREGYGYAAKDQSGFVYGFRTVPYKNGPYWVAGDSDNLPLCSTYNFLDMETVIDLNLLSAEEDLYYLKSPGGREESSAPDGETEA